MSSCASFGAKGIHSFSENISYGYLPAESSIEYEGLYFDYYFTTVKDTDKLFQPVYNSAITKDPLSGQKEYYLSVGLASCADGEGFYKYGGRPTLNMVIVLDISGSMGSSFHLDNESKSKLDVAKDVLLSLVDKLKPDDRFGLVLFDTQATVLHKLQLWGKTDVNALKDKILKISTGGGTTLNVGLSAATDLYDSLKNDPNENRIIFLTDMQPNLYDDDSKAMLKIAHTNAYSKKIYTTFIGTFLFNAKITARTGVGIDFNTDMVAQISHIRATNYFAVKSAKDFKRQMNEEFDYIVSPNVFDCEITIDGPSRQQWGVVRVFGSPGHDHPKDGQLLFMDSSFPSVKTGETETKGGVIVVLLRKLDPSASTLSLVTKYKDRLGKEYTEKQDFNFPKDDNECFENISVRKAVLLTRYVSFMKHFLRDSAKKSSQPSVSSTTGVFPPAPLDNSDGKEKRVPLEPLKEEYVKIFKVFLDYMQAEMDVINDKQLEKEYEQLHNIYDKKPK